jgi:hypothetical protein
VCRTPIIVLLLAAASDGDATPRPSALPTQVPVDFTLDTLTRKKIEKWRRQQKDARLHNRLSTLLWLSQGLVNRTLEQKAA